ncbi:MAG: hypothetical protein ORN83_10980, partial [Chthoniobacteraceae bacterium]|nr:hypothetical protein [Chthoniobacteraceae bacterium]
MSEPLDLTERRFQGIPVSPGIARGTVWLQRPEDETVPHYEVKLEQTDAEVSRLEGALLNTRLQIQ